MLGRGGFGIVLKAFEELLHRVVAIKVMAPHLAATWLVDMVARLHAKKVEERFPSARGVADLLAKHLAEIQEHGGGIPADPRRGRGTSPQGEGPPRRAEARRSLTRRWALAAGILALVLFLGWTGFKSGPGLLSPPPPSNRGILEFELDSGMRSGKASLYRLEDKYQDDKLVAVVDLASTRRMELPAGDYKLEVDQVALGLGASGVMWDSRITIAPGQRTKVGIRWNWQVPMP